MVIQGLGNVGYFTARFFQEGGAILVGLAEAEGAIANPNGLEIEKLAGRTGASGVRCSTSPAAPTCPDARMRSRSTATSSFPAALERQITAENAPHVKAKIVVEAANGPTTQEADEILFKRNVIVIPDVTSMPAG